MEIELKKYTANEFLKFFERQSKTMSALDRMMERLEKKDEKIMEETRNMLGLESGLSDDILKKILKKYKITNSPEEEKFKIEFNTGDMKVVYAIEPPDVKAFYQVKLKIWDLESGKDISKNTYLCGMISNGKPSKNFEIKQITKKELVRT